MSTQLTDEQRARHLVMETLKNNSLWTQLAEMGVKVEMHDYVFYFRYRHHEGKLTKNDWHATWKDGVAQNSVDQFVLDSVLAWAKQMDAEDGIAPKTLVS